MLFGFLTDGALRWEAHMATRAWSALDMTKVVFLTVAVAWHGPKAINLIASGSIVQFCGNDLMRTIPRRIELLRTGAE